jgi:peptide chain release factor subunit 3
VAYCGDNIRLRIRGISDEDVQPGFVLTSPKNPVKAVTAFKADLSILEAKSIITGGFSCVLHVHTLSEEVTISVRAPTSVFSIHRPETPLLVC